MGTYTKLPPVTTVYASDGTSYPVTLRLLRLWNRDVDAWTSLWLPLTRLFDRIASTSRLASLHTPRSLASSVSTWRRPTVQSSVSGGASSVSASTLPTAVVTFLVELGPPQLVILDPPATSGSSEASVHITPASSGTLGGAASTSESSTSVTVASDACDDSGLVIPSTLHKGKDKRPAKSSAKPQSTPLPPKKKQRLSRPSVDLKARGAAQQAATEHSDLGFALWERAHLVSVAVVEQWLQQLSDHIGSDASEYLETLVVWRACNKARNLRADRIRLHIPKQLWLLCTPDAGGKLKCPPEILLEPSVLHYSFEILTWALSTAVWTVEVVDLDARQPWRNCRLSIPAEHSFNTTFAPCNPSVPLFAPEGTTQEEVRAAIVLNPALRQSHVTAPWVQEFADARAQAAADSSAAVDSTSDSSSARTPIPAADQAVGQAELGELPLPRLGFTSWPISHRRLRFRFRSIVLLIIYLFSNHIELVQRLSISSSSIPRQFP
ncbi:unnamed protein product [Phytophthora fragariaefolia]|uniref:Unnamed protein product n=1 Tax=Phytophthora fragariaefolia TaxID=1490495 RepID=A0A9W6U7E2_9STRA|nr:unnamed protein product [Phytophthora fragariaefolia]